MRRFWLLLLLMVLPVQMSWAAIHHCDDTPRRGGSPVTANQSADYAVADASDDQDRADAPVKKVPSAHACHGLHELMTHPVQVFVEPTAETALASAAPAFCPSVTASRRERPQWAAA